jgi:hypothetical protein
VLLARLSQLNATTVFLTTGVLVLAGLLAPHPIGGIVLLLLAAALTALARVTWSLGTPRTRAARVLILGLLLVLAIVRLT